MFLVVDVLLKGFVLVLINVNKVEGFEVNEIVKY